MALWKIDPTHSEVNFKVKHLVVSTVTGHFNSFDATIESANDDFSDATITFEADVNSINTKNEQRDGHLKSPDFFDAVNFPKMSFVSTSVKKTSDFITHEHTHAVVNQADVIFVSVFPRIQIIEIVNRDPRGPIL